MKLCISALGHARKVKFSSYVHLPSINKPCVILFNLEEIYILVHEHSISVVEHVRMLILSSHVLLADVNIIIVAVYQPQL